MRPARFGSAFAMFLCAGVVGGCAEQTRTRIDIDPRSDEVLRKMSAALGGAKSFSFHSVATMEEPVATGQMAEFSREVQVVVRRPDRIRVEGHQNDAALFLWYEGNRLTVVDKTAKTYASVQVPDRIDAMLDDVAEKHGLTLPLADLLFSDPYKVLTADAHMGRYVGLDEAGGVKCHHLMFTQEAIDWQIWIDAGKDPLPRKFVIDYKSLPGRPEFSAELSNWNLAAPSGDEQFKSVVPNDAKQVELARLFDAAAKGE